MGWISFYSSRSWKQATGREDVGREIRDVSSHFDHERLLASLHALCGLFLHGTTASPNL